VGFLAVSLSKALFKKSTVHNMHELGAGFFLHDLGKVHIDPAIINKPGKLTEEEMTRMKQHPTMGYKVLYETNQLTHECKKIVLQHHERLMARDIRVDSKEMKFISMEEFALSPTCLMR
jgi:HD-GYP domain-containing protein (c-di-GMP phosphodiesterase class II)